MILNANPLKKDCPEAKTSEWMRNEAWRKKETKMSDWMRNWRKESETTGRMEKTIKNQKAIPFDDLNDLGRRQRIWHVAAIIPHRS
jgi:hypothetical protein